MLADKKQSKTFKSTCFSKSTADLRKPEVVKSDFKKVNITGSITRNEKNWRSNIGEEWASTSEGKIFNSKNRDYTKSDSIQKLANFEADYTR